MLIKQRYLFAPLVSVLLLAQPAAAQSAAGRALDLNNATALQVGSLEQQLQKLDLKSAFTAAALTSAERITQGQATMVRLRALTAQRHDIARRHANEIAALKANAPQAFSGIDTQLTEGRKVHDELHAARIEVADAGDAVLAWARAQQGSIRLELNRLRMQSPEQQRQFNDLFAVLEAAMVRHDKAVDASEAYRKAHQGRLNRAPIPAQGKPTRF